MPPPPGRGVGWRAQALFAAALACALVLLGAVGAARAADQKPNVVLMLADNLGYGDVGVYNPSPRAARTRRPEWCIGVLQGILLAVGVDALIELAHRSIGQGSLTTWEWTGRGQQRETRRVRARGPEGLGATT